MSSQYLLSRKWSLTSRFTITDAFGVPRFEVQGKSMLNRKLSLYDTMGTEIAVISRQGLGQRYQILAGGQATTVRPRGFLGRRFEIDSPGGALEASGNFSGRQYAITRGGMPAAAVSQLRTLREQFTVEISDGEDDALMLAVVLVIETIRDERRQSAGS
jgi:uncharacterized protein YxjI